MFRQNYSGKDFFVLAAMIFNCNLPDKFKFID